jgi:hypothetical protein
MLIFYVVNWLAVLSTPLTTFFFWWSVIVDSAYFQLSYMSEGQPVGVQCINCIQKQIFQASCGWGGGGGMHQVRTGVTNWKTATFVFTVMIASGSSVVFLI